MTMYADIWRTDRQPQVRDALPADRNPSHALPANDRYAGKRSEIDAKISRLGAEMIELKRHRNSLSPALRLPSELLSIIFLLVKHRRGVSADILLENIDLAWIPAVTHVCWRWREAALRTPRLWTWLVPDAIGIYDTMLQRARRENACPLTIYHAPKSIDDHRWRVTRHRNEVALPRAIADDLLARVERLEIVPDLHHQGTGMMRWLEDVLVRLEKAPTPLLRRLVVSFENNEEAINSKLISIPLCILANRPALEELVLVGPMKVDDWAYLGHPFNLTRLELNLSGYRPFKIEHLAAVLSVLNRLEHLSLSHSLGSGDTDNDFWAAQFQIQTLRPELNTIHLPNLKTLRMCETPALAARFLDTLSDYSLSSATLDVVISLTRHFDEYEVLQPFTERFWKTCGNDAGGQIRQVSMRKEWWWRHANADDFDHEPSDFGITMDAAHPKEYPDRDQASRKLYIQFLSSNRGGSLGSVGVDVDPSDRVSTLLGILSWDIDLSQAEKLHCDLDCMGDQEWAELAQVVENVKELEHPLYIGDCNELLHALEQSEMALALALGWGDGHHGAHLTVKDVLSAQQMVLVPFQKLEKLQLGADDCTDDLGEHNEFPPADADELKWLLRYVEMRAKHGRPLVELSVNIGYTVDSNRDKAEALRRDLCGWVQKVHFHGYHQADLQDAGLIKVRRVVV